MMFMLLGSFFSWWYGKGWAQVLKSFTSRLAGVAEAFSVVQLSRTLFSPWRRIISYPDAGLAEKFRAWIDNLISRVVGFVVRVLVLLAALVVFILVAIVMTIETVLWPLLPPAIIGCLVAGLLL